MKLNLKNFPDLLEKCKSAVHNGLAVNVDPKKFDALTKGLEERELLVPDDTIQSVIRSMVERDFLNDSLEGVDFKPGPYAQKQGWIRISRLPISPLEEKQYAMYPRWQNTIATLHTLNHRLCYVLLRKNGKTQLYLGAIPTDPDETSQGARSQLAQAIRAQMPGIGIEFEKTAPSKLANLSWCGAVTGIPSVRKITEYGEYQTMDQIAMGLRHDDIEQDFAVVVVADPVPDVQIVEVLRAMENIGSEVHALAQYTKTCGNNVAATISMANSEGVNAGVNVGGSSTQTAGIDAGVPGLGMSLSNAISKSIGVNVGGFISSSVVQGKNVGTSDSVAVQYISKSAMYCEALFDKHIERMKAVRNLGFWKTGVYVLAGTSSNVQTVMGMLRAVYSGDDSYIEPIRTAIMPADSGANEVVQLFQHLPYDYPPVAETFGHLFEDYATPMTTEELSIATSLPRRDVPGLRLIRNASRFATNPPVIKGRSEGGKPVTLGKILDTGANTHQNYQLDLNQMVRHALVAGTNGSGKTYTCKSLLGKVQQEKIPFLVIEPAKDEYMEWAIEQNKLRAKRGEKKIRIFAPGYFGELGITSKQKDEIQNLLKEYNELTDVQKKLVPKAVRHRLNTLLEELETLTGEKQGRAAAGKGKLPPRNQISSKDHDAADRIAEMISRTGDIEDLHLNLFQPTAMNGTWINIMKHLDRIKSALISSMPMSDVLPLVMIDTLYEHTQNEMSIEGYSMNDEINPLLDVYRDDGTVQYPLLVSTAAYPDVTDMAKTASTIIGNRDYANDVKNNLKAAMRTRINTLVLGWKKELFNVVRSTDLAQMFEADAVINLSHLTDDADKALVMSILLIGLWEYRESRYKNDRKYKQQADQNQLMHLTLIEEAHRLMPDVREDGSGMNSQQTTAKMFSHMLSEIRAYGEGCIVVDQVPTRLIPDAVKNTNLKIIHRLTAADDIQAVSTSMRLRPDQQAVIGALQPGEAIACSDFDDAAAWLKVDPVPKN